MPRFIHNETGKVRYTPVGSVDYAALSNSPEWDLDTGSEANEELVPPELGVELEYVEITGPSPRNFDNTEDDIVGLTFTVDFEDDRPVMLHARAPMITNNTADRINQLKIYDITGGGNVHLDLGAVHSPAAGRGGSCEAWARIPPQPPGTQRTYEVRGVCPDGGVASLLINPAPVKFAAFFEAIRR